MSSSFDVLRALRGFGCLAALTLLVTASACSDPETVGGDKDEGADVETDTPDIKGDDLDMPDVLEPDGDDDVDETDVPDATPDVQPDVPDEPDGGPIEEPLDKGYPAGELLIKITSPGGRLHEAVVGGTTMVAGLLFGEADQMFWQSSKGQDGEIDVATFWRSGPIALDPGDNTITVTAVKGDVVVTDTIVVTYNPLFKFDGPVNVRPNVVWLDQPIDGIFTVAMGLYANFEPSSVALVQVDADGNVIKEVGQMYDNGQVGSTGDEIQGDGVYSRKYNMSCSDTKPLWFRAKVTVKGASSYTAYSAPVPVWCAQHLTATECQSHHAVVMQAEAQILAGTSAEDVVDALLGNPQVADAGLSEGDGHTIWIQFTNGLLGAVLAPPAGMRGAGGSGFDAPPGFDPQPMGVQTVEIGSRNAIVLAPFQQEFGATDDGPAVAAAIAASACPSFALEGGAALSGVAASLSRFRSISNFGITSISTHGDALFGDLDPAAKKDEYHWDHMGAQEVVWSGEPVVCSQMLQEKKSCTVTGANPTGGCPSGSVCVVTQGTGGGSSSGTCLDQTQADLRLGRLVLTNKGYAMTPSFFEAYAGAGYPNSLVNLGACRTFWNGSLATTLFAFGAKAITGFSDYVDSNWARAKVTKLIEGSVGQGMVGHAHDGGRDPSNPATAWRILGATNLDLSSSDIINASFETGDTTGWRRDGDGRVISQLGSSAAVHGKFMGLVSTGLGFTVQTGTLEQDFCIPESRTEIEVYWKFFSEEFKEFCGSSFQDTFQVTLTGAAGKLTVVDVKVDDLCGYSDGSCGSCANPVACDEVCMGTGGCKADINTGLCTGTYPCNCGKYFVGLTPSDVSFDVGGVFNVLWQKTVKNIQALAGAGKVNLRIYATDTGDSIYDTAILVDAIKFN